MEASLANKFFSADGHVIEPEDLWTTRLDARWRDRAPHFEPRPQGDYTVIDGMAPMPMGLEGTVINDKVAGEIRSAARKRRSDARAGSSNPHARLADQDLDNLRGEVIYPGVGLALCGAPDAEYQAACFRAYNDWLAEFCAVAPQRLLGAGVIPPRASIDSAIKEAHRIARSGLKTVVMVTENVERPYISPEYDPWWAAMEEIGIPVAIHSGSTTKNETPGERGARMGHYGPHVVDTKIGRVMRALADLIWSGAVQKHPGLRIVMVEGGIGWVACTLRLMDHWWSDHWRWMKPRLEEPPSFYYKRNFYSTFEDDRAGLLTRELLNVDHLMWGSDYPHTEGTFPRSRERIAEDFRDIAEADTRKMVCDNAMRLYGLAAR